jgi:hypothetical protein
MYCKFVLDYELSWLFTSHLLQDYLCILIALRNTCELYCMCIYVHMCPCVMNHFIIYSMWGCEPTRSMTSSFLRFIDHKQRRATVGRTPLDELPSRRRDLYLTTHNTHNRQTSMPSAGFEPTIPACEQSQNHALKRAVTAFYCKLYFCAISKSLSLIYPQILT